MFPYDAKRARDFLRQELDLVVNYIEAKNLQSAIDRGLFKKYGNDYRRINLVAGYTEKQYAQMAEFEAQGICACFIRLLFLLKSVFFILSIRLNF